ncbi:hypothetical protein MJD09_21015 [bacterium]|nr:hypothetical protein [bacterium]
MSPTDCCSPAQQPLSPWSWITVGVAAGLLVGVGFDFYVHRTGRSPAPHKGLIVRLAADGGIGLAVASVVLLISILINQRFGNVYSANL